MDVSQLVVDGIEGAKLEFCRGQHPQDLASLRYVVGGEERVGVSEGEFWAAPEWMRAYIVGNDAQWAEECERP